MKRGEGREVVAYTSDIMSTRHLNTTILIKLLDYKERCIHEYELVSALNDSFRLVKLH